MGKYFNELKKAMDWLGEKDDTIFMGQAVTYAGTAMTNTLKDVPANKKLELPVFEEMQTGMTVGMALNNTVPVSIYPRWNFLVLGDVIFKHHRAAIFGFYPMFSNVAV